MAIFSRMTRALQGYMKNPNLKQFIIITTIGLFMFAADLRGTTGVSLEIMGKQYYTGTYNSDHWAMQPYVKAHTHYSGVCANDASVTK